MAADLSMTVLANWTLANINFTADCETASKFASKYIEYWNVIVKTDKYGLMLNWTSINSQFTATDEFLYEAFINAVRSVALDPFLKLAVETVTDWADSLNITSFETLQALEDITKCCRNEFSYSLSWEGNPDLAGIGACGTFASSHHEFRRLLKH